MGKKLKTKQPCQTPGCDSPNWHLCPLDKSKPDLFPMLLKQEARGERKAPSGMPDWQREEIAESQRKRWESIRREQKPLDDKMIARYKEGDVSVTQVANEFSVGRDRVLRVLREAEERGEVTIRKRGSNITSRKGTRLVRSN